MKLNERKLKAEATVKSPEDIDSFVMLNGDEHEEPRKKREATIQLLRTRRILPMKKRSMTFKQLRKIIYTKLSNETVRDESFKILSI